ncbi:uncharacterized protein C8Q71DRAFT_909529 [Rhodofomes roseus]|uniref:Uncharacterized protein n=1 Tax=Rhodofomes roseus TaxID=34475 RepID=A0ABQ8K9M4_9APHY|nr:uncharacterized protein C8Q71DRAFT_909529 [Rhodofomes roseus]KAH9833487.1 hypothetical protein C8Q71DRAFT_909529 [Rhodofomes roseus]
MNLNTNTFIGTVQAPFSDAGVSQPGPGPPSPLQPLQPAIAAPHLRPIIGRGSPLAPPIQAFQFQRPPSSQSSDTRRAQSAQLLTLDSSRRGQALVGRSQFAPGEVVDIAIIPCSLEQGKRLFKGSFAVSEAEKRALFTLLQDHGCVTTVTLDENALLKPLLDQHIRQHCEHRHIVLPTSQSSWSLPSLRVISGGAKLQFVKASANATLTSTSTLMSVKSRFAKLQGVLVPDRIVIPVVPSESVCVSNPPSLPTEWGVTAGAGVSTLTPTSPSIPIQPPIMPTFPPPNTIVDGPPPPRQALPPQAPRPVQPFGVSLNRPHSRTSTVLLAAPALQSQQQSASAESMAIDPQLLALRSPALPALPPDLGLPPNQHMLFPDPGPLYLPHDPALPAASGVRRSRSASMDESSTSTAPSSNRQRVQINEDRIMAEMEEFEVELEMDEMGAGSVLMDGSVQNPFLMDETSTSDVLIPAEPQDHQHPAAGWKANLIGRVNVDIGMALKFKDAFHKAASDTWQRDDEPQVYITAPTAKFSARAVTTYLAQKFQNKYGDQTSTDVYNAPHGTSVDDVNLSGYLNPYTRGIYIGPAVGPGPEVSTFFEILRTLAAPHENGQFEHPSHQRESQPIPVPWGLWEERHGYVVPTLDDITGNLLEDDRMAVLSAQGMVAALVIGHHLRAPRPIHPLVILWAILGDRAFEMSLELLEKFDHVAAQELRPWFALGPSDALPSGGMYLSHPIWSLLMNRLGIQPRRIGFTLDSRTRLRYTRQLICSIVLGKVATSAPELQAFRQGFDIDIATRDALGADLQHFTELFSKPVLVSGGQSAILDPVVVIRTLYDRTVAGPQDVARLITFEFTPGGAQSERSLCERIVKFRLLRWLHGHGHPDHPLVHNTMLLDHEYGDPATLRARLLLQAVTECQDLPVDPLWRLQFRFNHAGVHTSKVPVLDLHTCTGYCVIDINPWLHNALLEESDFGDPSVVTLFDCWLHEQVVHNQQDHSSV